MLKVRKYLTEILLEVTNSEIASIAKEVLFRAKNRGICYENTILISLDFSCLNSKHFLVFKIPNQSYLRLINVLIIN